MNEEKNTKDLLVGLQGKKVQKKDKPIIFNTIQN